MLLRFWFRSFRLVALPLPFRGPARSVASVVSVRPCVRRSAVSPRFFAVAVVPAQFCRRRVPFGSFLPPPPDMGNKISNHRSPRWTVFFSLSLLLSSFCLLAAFPYTNSFISLFGYAAGCELLQRARRMGDLRTECYAQACA